MDQPVDSKWTTSGPVPEWPLKRIVTSPLRRAGDGAGRGRARADGAAAVVLDSGPRQCGYGGGPAEAVRTLQGECGRRFRRSRRPCASPVGSPMTEIRPARRGRPIPGTGGSARSMVGRGVGGGSRTATVTSHLADASGVHLTDSSLGGSGVGVDRRYTSTVRTCCDELRNTDLAQLSAAAKKPGSARRTPAPDAPIGAGWERLRRRMSTKVTGKPELGCEYVHPGAPLRLSGSVRGRHGRSARRADFFLQRAREIGSPGSSARNRQGSVLASIWTGVGRGAAPQPAAGSTCRRRRSRPPTPTLSMPRSPRSSGSAP